jgi:hypothetical protein
MRTQRFLYVLMGVLCALAVAQGYARDYGYSSGRGYHRGYAGQPPGRFKQEFIERVREWLESGNLPSVKKLTKFQQELQGRLPRGIYKKVQPWLEKAIAARQQADGAELARKQAEAAAAQKATANQVAIVKAAEQQAQEASQEAQNAVEDLSVALVPYVAPTEQQAQTTALAPYVPPTEEKHNVIPESLLSILFPLYPDFKMPVASEPSGEPSTALVPHGVTPEVYERRYREALASSSTVPEATEVAGV